MKDHLNRHRWKNIKVEYFAVKIGNLDSGGYLLDKETAPYFFSFKRVKKVRCECFNCGLCHAYISDHKKNRHSHPFVLEIY